MLAFIQFIRLVKKAKTLPYFYPPHVSTIFIFSSIQLLHKIHSFFT